MKPKETINLYRVISLLVIALVTFGVMGGLCAKSHLYPDEWLSMFFLTLIFLLACMFELEYERKQKGISANTQTTFIRLSVTYTVSGGLIYAISYLPEFYRPVMIPVILLTAKGEVNDRIHGLEMGADDYVVKPFEMKELLARINAVLRRSEIPEDTHKRLTFDKLIIDLDSYELIVDGKKIDTPPKELELLYHLAATPNRVYTRNQLLDEVWGFDYFGDSRTVDVHVKRLREKVENVSDQWALKTVWGVGYKFEVK